MVSITAVIFLYSQILQTQVDQKTMAETKTSSMNVVAEIHERLGAENLLSEELRYCFIGVPAGNPMYYRSETFWKANGYAYIGGIPDPPAPWSGISCKTADCFLSLPCFSLYLSHSTDGKGVWEWENRNFWISCACH